MEAEFVEVGCEHCGEVQPVIEMLSLPVESEYSCLDCAKVHHLHPRI